MSTTQTTVLADNAYGTIASSLTVVDTTLNFTTGHGARFPVVASPNVMYCCILNSGNVLEEIKITAHTSGSDSATIVRGAGGTTAKAWSAGDRIEARVSSTVLYALAKDYVSVKDPAFGAVGDGVTDDSTAIAAAITAVKAAGGGVVRFPSGVYKCNITITGERVRLQVDNFGYDGGTSAGLIPATLTSPVIQIGDGTTTTRDIGYRR